MTREVSFRLSAEDYVAANRDWFFKTIRRSSVRTVIFGLLGLIVAIGAVQEWLTGGSADAITLVAALMLVVIVAWPLFYLIGYLTVPRRTRRLYRQHKALALPTTYNWSEEGILYRSAAGEFQMAWRDMWRWTCGKRTFLFMPNEAAFYPIPLHVLTQAQVADLRALAERHGPPRL